MAAERALGNTPKDVGREKRGYDIESAPAADKGKQRFIEVKGRKMGARDVTLTRNELHCALNSQVQFILALAAIDGEPVGETRYVRQYNYTVPGGNTVSIQENLQAMLGASIAPS